MNRETTDVLFGLTLMVCAFSKRARVLTGVLLLIDAVGYSNGWWR